MVKVITTIKQVTVTNLCLPKKEGLSCVSAFNFSLKINQSELGGKNNKQINSSW